MAERTGCPVLFSLWSYVIAILMMENYICFRKDHSQSWESFNFWSATYREGLFTVSQVGESSKILVKFSLSDFVRLLHRRSFHRSLVFLLKGIDAGTCLISEPDCPSVIVELETASEDLICWYPSLLKRIEHRE